ncbi:MAG: Eco57I restriction-modification methylase domain-containing protein [Longimicrobiaceae bacterium]
MVATKGAQAATAPYDNRNLFSDHYLATGAREHPEWAEEVDGAWSHALELYAATRHQLPRLNEAQTEEEWVRPILARVLGWSYSVQPDAPLFGRRNRPDYLLFTTPAAKAAGNGSGAHAAAVADAKYWARPLDREVKDARNGLSNANPSFQIVTYLVATGVDWGILTNGKEWRLYAMRARSRVDTYFAVDLERILEDRDPAAFRWFWLFFRAAAFRGDAATGESFLDRMLGGSLRHGAELEARLKTRIYEEVFPHLARGFVRWRREAGAADESPAALREVYEGTLRLLYRLLFVLYAEARGLLPVDQEGGYGRYGLVGVRRRVAEALSRGYRLSEVAGDLWNDLAALFRILDRGDPGLAVPRYGGALFGAAHPRNAFFATHGIADAWLYPALERLTRDADGHFIDYGSLSVQQLGSIYEGLLEYELQAGEDGEVRLHRDKARRHGSGSYYTPQFVVRYMVDSTLGPVLAERAERFRSLMREIAPLKARLATARAKLAENPQRADGGRWTAETNDVLRRLSVLEPAAVDALLGMRVCDPAMGSGHFLVDATEWITEQVVLLLDELPDNPVFRDIAAMRGHIVDDLGEQGIAIEPERLKDAHLLRRLVVKRCIYGVDLNPMAVELAQLSLWLDSFTYGAPLSFLDHHLKPGNSLLGTTLPAALDAMAASPAGQLDAFGVRLAGVLRAAELMDEVASVPDATPDEALQSLSLYRDVQRLIAPDRALLDAWTSRAFGNRAAVGLVMDHGGQVREAGAGSRNPFGKKERETLERARALACEHHFFHWDLEFPEVFYDLRHACWKDDPGFDAVLGNPPYVRQEQVGAAKPYLAAEYTQVHDGAADLYVYFYQKGMELLRRGGRLSYIVTNKWLRAGYGERLRGHVAHAARVERVVDFGHAPVFPDADVFPCIVLLRKRREGGAEPEGVEGTLVCTVPREALGSVELGGYVAGHGYRVPADRFTAAPWSLEPPEVQRLMEKIRAAGVPLARFVGSKPYRGLLTGLNEAFLVDGATRGRLVERDPRSAELLRPFVRGQDVERWSPAWAGLWMIVLRSSENHPWPWSGAPERQAERLFERTYPGLYAHLKPMEAQLRKRTDQGQYWWELRSCAYYGVFAGPKILYPDITWSSGFCYDDEGRFCNNTVYFIPSAPPWALAVLNSPAMWYFASKTAVHGKDEVLRLFASFVEELPIPAPPDAWHESGEAALERLRALTSGERRVRRELAEWLRVEFGVDKPGQKLESFAGMEVDGFVAEVKRRRPRTAPGVTPRDLARLTEAYAEHAPRIREMAREAAALEERLAGLVNEAYGLTDEDVRLMWQTAPPRMPVRSPEFTS